MQRDALQKTGKLPLEAFDDEESHNLINRVVTGGDSNVVQLMQNGLSLIEYTPTLFVSAVVLGLISIWIPLIIIGGAILLRVFEIRMGARVRHFESERCMFLKGCPHFLFFGRIMHPFFSPFASLW